MEETKEQQRMLSILQLIIYFSVLIELFVFSYSSTGLPAGALQNMLGALHDKIALLPVYGSIYYSKLFTLSLISLASIGTRSKKQRDLNVKTQILLPLLFGLVVMLCSTSSYHRASEGPAGIFQLETTADLLLAGYYLSAIIGTVLVHLAMDNISKLISSKLGKDKWNVEGESFMQQTRCTSSPHSVNIPTQFYYRGRVRDGWINITNIFRALLVIGVPGSGKTFGIINPAIRQLIAKEFCACIYDYKHPDLGLIAYHHYRLAQARGKCARHSFHVINLNDLEHSRRINPWRPEYLTTLAEASESAEALVEALKKGDKSGGADQFFTQSAINFLAACIYFFARHEKGRYSSFPHVLSFLNCTYEDIFNTLFSVPELVPLLSPFKTAFHTKAFNQLEGQIGTLKIFISRLATKETYWVFSGDDFDLKISSKANPAIMVLANDPSTQSINSACYSVIVNRLCKLMNSKGNLPSAIIVDEVPTLYIHKIENLIAVARSNKVGIILGLQELPQFRQQYGKDTAATITSVIGNVLSGAARNKETLDWLERLFGKVKQQSESVSIDRNKTSVSISEKLEPLVPAGKIASLKTGEIAGILASDPLDNYDGKFETSAVNCKVNLDHKLIEREQQQYAPLPRYYDFGKHKEAILIENFNRINDQVRQVVNSHSPGPH